MRVCTLSPASRLEGEGSLFMLRRHPAHLLNRLLKPAGIELRRLAEPNDLILEKVAPFTATSRERIVALCDAVEYIVRMPIEGAFVECGVWRGGSSMAAALALQRAGAAERDLHRLDTFEGMPPASEHDRESSTGVPALDEWK